MSDTPFTETPAVETPTVEPVVTEPQEPVVSGFDPQPLKDMPTEDLHAAHAAVTDELNARGELPVPLRDAASVEPVIVQPATLTDTDLSALHAEAANQLAARGLLPPAEPTPAVASAPEPVRHVGAAGLLTGEFRHLSDEVKAFIDDIESQAHSLYASVKALPGDGSAELDIAKQKVKEAVMWVKHHFTG